MAGRFINPYSQFMDATPSVYSGGKLNFYATGTSSRLNTYTTKALSVANPNPIILNSAGRPAVDIFLQDLEYKVVLTDANDNVIWTADPVSHRDSLLVAKTVTGSGSPNGSVAGTAGSSSVLPDFYWDYTNSILYVCTTTGTSSTAVWTAINAASAAAAVPPPQGCLTIASGNPIPPGPGDYTAATSIYYTPHIGNTVPIYNGSTFTPTAFSELTLTLSSSHVASNIYDVYVFSNSGVLTLVTGPSWSAGTAGSITAGSCARGTGAGGASLARVNGLYTNNLQITGRNGATTYSINANLATYLGSIFMDGTNGQISCHRTYGLARKWGVWNAYNRAPVILKAGDATASWSYTSATIRQARTSVSNTITIFSGLAEDIYTAKIYGNWTIAGAAQGTTLTARVGIGFNSTTAYSGFVASFSGAASTSVTDKADGSSGEYVIMPLLGINSVNMLENSQATTSTTFLGTETNHLLTVEYRA